MNEHDFKRLGAQIMTVKQAASILIFIIQISCLRQWLIEVRNSTEQKRKNDDVELLVNLTIAKIFQIFLGRKSGV